jgi:drug/metabolite transporter (DMT)-like permease
MLLSPFFLGEKLSKLRALGVAVAIVGMVAVSGIFSGGAHVDLRGVLLGLAAAMFYAGVVMLNKKLTGMSSYEITLTQLVISFAVLALYTLFTGDILAFGELDGISLIWLLVAGVVHTGLAYALYFGSIKALKAQTAAIFGYVDPVVAIILSAIVLGDRMGVFEIIGAVLILGATLVCELSDK